MPAATAADALAVPCVLDVEASGFGGGSHPIEIGFVREDGVSGCSLIRPESDWTHWQSAAERVHGIDRATLMAHGRPAVVVATQLNEALAGRIVYCDGWAHDYAWLAKLFDAAELWPRFRLESVHALLTSAQLERLDAAHRAVRAAAGAVRHRASSDARLLQQALVAVLRGDAPSNPDAAATTAARTAGVALTLPARPRD